VSTYQVRNTVLRIEDVSLTFGTTQILRDVNGKIDDIVGHGQVVGLLGPSGIGKTQLFNILAGLRKPTTGRVLINDTGTPVTAGAVGVVGQKYPLIPHKTVIKNLVFAGTQSGKSKVDAKAKSLELLERFKLADRANYYPVQLSGGQRQRIAIAQQMLCSEHFLLMDEPFSGLDPLMNDEVCALISEVANMDELNTIIVVSHDLRSAIKVADTLWLMGRGRDDAGNIIPGAYIKKTYDLIERNLAWRPEISKTVGFLEFSNEVKEEFKLL
jgi:ABC-type nitrate/sulfonate/bicarbonate transport system ATPase subunit